LGAINNGLAFDSQSIGWRSVGPALQNHGASARYACGRGCCYRSRSRAGQPCLVDCRGDCSSERQHTGWLFCWNADSRWPERPHGKQVIPPFSYYVSTKHRALAPARAASPSTFITLKRLLVPVGAESIDAHGHGASTQVPQHLKADQRNLSMALRW
jgi:hypothetical protein